MNVYPDKRFMGPDGIVYPSKEAFYEKFASTDVRGVDSALFRRVADTSRDPEQARSLRDAVNGLDQVYASMQGEAERLANAITALGGPFPMDSQLLPDRGDGMVGAIVARIDRLENLARGLAALADRLEKIA